MFSGVKALQQRRQIIVPPGLFWGTVNEIVGRACWPDNKLSCAPGYMSLRQEMTSAGDKGGESKKAGVSPEVEVSRLSLLSLTESEEPVGIRTSLCSVMGDDSLHVTDAFHMLSALATGLSELDPSFLSLSRPTRNNPWSCVQFHMSRENSLASVALVVDKENPAIFLLSFLEKEEEKAEAAVLWVSQGFSDDIQRLYDASPNLRVVPREQNLTETGREPQATREDFLYFTNISRPSSYAELQAFFKCLIDEKGTIQQSFVEHINNEIQKWYEVPQHNEEAGDMDAAPCLSLPALIKDWKDSLSLLESDSDDDEDSNASCCVCSCVPGAAAYEELVDDRPVKEGGDSTPRGYTPFLWVENAKQPASASVRCLSWFSCCQPSQETTNTSPAGLNASLLPPETAGMERK